MLWFGFMHSPTETGSLMLGVYLGRSVSALEQCFQVHCRRPQRILENWMGSRIMRVFTTTKYRAWWKVAFANERRAIKFPEFHFPACVPCGQSGFCSSSLCHQPLLEVAKSFQISPWQTDSFPCLFLENIRDQCNMIMGQWPYLIGDLHLSHYSASSVLLRQFWGERMPSKIPPRHWHCGLFGVRGPVLFRTNHLHGDLFIKSSLGTPQVAAAVPDDCRTAALLPVALQAYGGWEMIRKVK